MEYKIKFKRDEDGVWALLNPVLREKELALSKDTGQYKIGNGKDAWKDLPFSTTLPEEVVFYYENRTNNNRGEVPRSKSSRDRSGDKKSSWFTDITKRG
jgi:hypothetical protein